MAARTPGVTARVPTSIFTGSPGTMCVRENTMTDSTAKTAANPAILPSR